MKDPRNSVGRDPRRLPIGRWTAGFSRPVGVRTVVSLTGPAGGKARFSHTDHPMVSCDDSPSTAPLSAGGITRSFRARERNPGGAPRCSPSSPATAPRWCTLDETPGWRQARPPPRMPGPGQAAPPSGTFPAGAGTRGGRTWRPPPGGCPLVQMFQAILAVHRPASCPGKTSGVGPICWAIHGAPSTPHQAPGMGPSSRTAAPRPNICSPTLWGELPYCPLLAPKSLPAPPPH